MKIDSRFLLLIILLLNVGCAPVTRTYLAEDVFTQPVAGGKEYFTKDEKIDLSKINAANYEGAANKATRTILVSDMLALSDKKCTWHKATIMANANVWNIASGTAAILFAGAASVVEHVQTAAGLAAAAAATSGIRSLANQEIYADALMTTILRAIDVHREKKYAVIEAGMLEDDYTVAQAIRDVQAYHDACSLMAGMVEVTSALDNRKKSRSEVDRDIARLEGAIEGAGALLEGQSAEAKEAFLKPLREQLVQKYVALAEASE